MASPGRRMQPLSAAVVFAAIIGSAQADVSSALPLPPPRPASPAAARSVCLPRPSLSHALTGAAPPRPHRQGHASSRGARVQNESRRHLQSAGCANVVDDAGNGLVDVSDLLFILAAYGSGNDVADLDGDGTVAVTDLLAVLAQYGSTCTSEGSGGGSSAECAAEDTINLDQLDGVVATCTGCDRHSNDEVGGAATTIDMNHSPGAWTSSPHSTQGTCATQAYVTIDLGALHSLSGVTIWHYYGNQRAYCSQKIAISMTGEFSGEETVVYDTGTCSGWCSFPVTCTNAEAGDCTPSNYVSSVKIAGDLVFAFFQEFQQ